jgi:DNA-binding NarL/FixJ family response regulator
MIAKELHKKNIISTLKDLVTGIEQDTIVNYEIIQKSNGETHIKIKTPLENGGELEEFDKPMKLNTKERRKRVKSLYESGFTQQTISEKLNCSLKTVFNDIKELKNQGEI